MAAQVRTRKRGKTFSYIFAAGKTLDGTQKMQEVFAVIFDKNLQTRK
ncbi:MAG: hypothetical protein IKE46_01370 [Selenomonadaceae bacterium]|nr:hypothetical protein [Selenomonadaceae bacterium]